jgi:two-component system nitrogen regulation response regulator NtrX
MPDTLLIVDDEPGIRKTLTGILSDEGYSVQSAESGEEALRILRSQPVSLVLLDIWMPGQDGIETLKRIHDLYPGIVVVMMSGHGTIETAVRATKLGAYDFIEKPLSLEKLVLLIQHALRERRLTEENRSLRRDLERRFELVGHSPAVMRLRELIKMAAGTHSRVLITGESGTGKELVARSIHSQSGRADKPYVEVNCAAIPESLIESELFGYEKGAFTGAVGSRAGRFEAADGGTLFLDEIGDMAVATQAKVLRALQEQRFYRVGGNRPIEVDVRIIAATNKNLTDEIRKGGFREDLYYRLNVLMLNLPPLRERKEDIPLLADHFIEWFVEEQGVRPKTMTEEAIEILKGYSWPGNVRELRNLVERLMILVPRSVITAADVDLLMEPTALTQPSTPVPGQTAALSSSGSSLREARASFEREWILKKLEEQGWNISKTADVLQIERSHLHRKIKLLGIEVPDE